MKAFDRMVFDETIDGTTATWQTADEHDSVLGAADIVDFMAHASNVTGSSPTLTITAEHSADGRHWHEIADLVSGADLTADTLFRGSTGLSNPTLSLIRLRMTLGGTSPQCRLKIYATGRIL